MLTHIHALTQFKTRESVSPHDFTYRLVRPCYCDHLDCGHSHSASGIEQENQSAGIHTAQLGKH